MPLGRKIFVGTALVVVAALGSALLVTRTRTNAAAQAASARALRATRSAISDALASRSQSLRQLTAALVQVPAYVSRIGEALRTDDRGDLLDQADELRVQTGADWVLIVDGSGVLKAWTAQRGESDEDFSGGALIGRALEGRTTEGLWIETARRSGTSSTRRSASPWPIPPAARQYGVVVAALRIDSTFAAQLQRHTGSEILFFSRDTAGIPTVRCRDRRGEWPSRRGAPAPGRVHARRQRPDPVPVAAAGHEYEGVTGLLQTADGVPIGGYVGLHDRQDELAAWRHLSRAIGWAFAGGLLLALGSSVVLARQITRPVRQLVAATRQVSEGTYADVPVPNSRDEIADLATAFGRMIEELREKDRLVAYFRTQPPATVVAPRTGDGSIGPGTSWPVGT